MFVKMTDDEGFLELLITLVKQYPELYDKNEKNYYNTQVKRDIWNDISKQCGKTDHKCRHRWKLMRERFTKEMKRLQKPLGRGQTYREPWQYFDQMMFLRESISSRRTDSKLRKSPSSRKNKFITVQELYDGVETTTFSESRPISTTSLLSTENLAEEDETQSTNFYQTEHETSVHSVENHQVINMLQEFCEVANTCNKQQVEGKEFASLLAINMLMQDLPEYMKDEFLKDMYIKIMELRSKARVAGELLNKNKN